MTIGQRIKQARKSNHLSLRDLAAQAEISPMAISKYEPIRLRPVLGYCCACLRPWG